MTHNGRTHSHMVTVLPRPERHSTVIPRPVPPRWARKKRTWKATKVDHVSENTRQCSTGPTKDTLQVYPS